MLYIQDIDLTPNPNALKFIVNDFLLLREKRSFADKSEAANDPLAKAIFDLDGVASVFYTDKFITVEKEVNGNWNSIQKNLTLLIKSFDKDSIPPEKEINQPADDLETPTFKKIKSIVDRRIRPALEGDGGGLDLLDFHENILKIRYIGACGSCPSSIRGTLVAIENLLKREINPDIKVVSAI
ncbi:MAG: NifU family protein [Chlorobi bacterium]|nr:NifU family protein [Chlorobiota bacterium]